MTKILKNEEIGEALLSAYDVPCTLEEFVSKVTKFYNNAQHYSPNATNLKISMPYDSYLQSRYLSITADVLETDEEYTARLQSESKLDNEEFDLYLKLKEKYDEKPN